MKDLITKIMMVVMTFAASVTFAAHNNHHQTQKHYLIQFTSGDTYETTLNGNTLTWRGLAGEDKGLTSTSQIKRATLSKSTTVYQWTEKTGSFITLTLDKNNHQAICSGKDTKNNQWLLQGTFKALN